MKTDTVLDILKRIDEVEAELRSCETKLTGVRDSLLRANGMGRLLDDDTQPTHLRRLS